jgi:nicotinate phosphoribosyltransferase
VSTLRRTRLDPATFALPVEKMRDGYYSDAYFTFTRDVLEHDDHRPDVLMQVFQRERSVLGGIDEALAILRLCSGRRLPDGGWEDGWDRLEVRALHDGDEIAPWETVMTIRGDYSTFAHLETLYLGVLARRTLISRNVRDVVAAAHGKPILYFPARFDHWQVQTGDGWAAHIAGAIGVSTDAQASWWGSEGIGTVPHALIAAYSGDTVEATRALAEQMPPDVQIISLVDFDNDCVATSLAVARALGPRLSGVRLDTSESMVDRSIVPQMGGFDPRGVNPQLVRNVRAALDAGGFAHVQITVSGGFDPAKIRQFESEGVPVDAYGVGSSLFSGRYDFTADIVIVDGAAVSKKGRAYRPNPRLERVVPSARQDGHGDPPDRRPDRRADHEPAQPR